MDANALLVRKTDSKQNKQKIGNLKGDNAELILNTNTPLAALH